MKKLLIILFSLAALELNAQDLFEALNRGSLAANSDHYPFAVRGDSYEPVFKLVTGFFENWDL